ncbi:hypothetical protein MTYM_00285 [Methylococcales bacterium]|nr:hypothetical protein MTYM_00285 [Methylococcales bacterium]
MKITLDIPEQYLIDSTPGEFGKNLKLYAALMMFKAGKLSAGSAAEFAEMDRYRFIEACEKNSIPVIDYPAEELRAEMESLKAII